MGQCFINQFPVPKKPEYSYTKFDAFNNNNKVKNHIKLEARLLNIDKDYSCQIKLNIFTNKEKTAFKPGGTTEIGSLDKKNGIISFQKFFVMQYFFEKSQPLEFVIFGSIQAKIQTSLQNIMGCRGQIFTQEIDGYDNVTLEIKGFEFEQKIINILYINICLKGDLCRKGLVYSFISKERKDKKQILYKSEGIKAIKSENSKNFILCTIPDIYISKDGNHDKSEVCISFDDAMNKKNLGEYNGTLASLINKDIKVQLKQNISASIKIEAIKNYSFLDYLRAGIEINLTVAIDFTTSNLPPDDKLSYHYLGSKQTIYEKAIKSCGDIVAEYDFDKKFPAFGFGGKFFGEPEVSHCFPLNGKMENPEIKGIEGILKAYRNVLVNSELSQPTYFHFIIDKLNEIVKKEVKEKKSIYNILMILTDGIIDDMNETIDSLVESSFLPISVIIIGIGNADFSVMNKLDADDNPLYDKNDRKADRDLVQFVPFINFQNDGQKLAEQVLEEVPRQIVEYYQHKKISPGQPKMEINI